MQFLRAQTPILKKKNDTNKMAWQSFSKGEASFPRPLTTKLYLSTFEIVNIPLPDTP